MRIKIRDWDQHFEADRSRQWKSLKWVPVPNKQGLGYKKIMVQKNGAEIFGCWNALIQQGSLCNPRGDLSKYSIQDISMNTMIPINILTSAINFIIQNLDWIEVIENIDINVNDNDKNSPEHAIGSSILYSSLSSSSLKKKDKFDPPEFGEFNKYCIDNNHGNIADRAFKGYSEANWYDSKGKKIRNWKQKLQHVWFRDENKDREKPEQVKQQKDISFIKSEVVKRLGSDYNGFPDDGDTDSWLLLHDTHCGG